MKVAVPSSSVVLACLSLLTGGCGDSDNTAESPGQEGLPAGHPAVPDGISDGGAGTISGAVAETMNSGGYTYARVHTEAGDVWVAGPLTALRLDERIDLAGAALMTDFTSASLGRSFDEIYFVGDFALGMPPPDGSRSVARQVLSGSGYTYVAVDVGEVISWIAGPEVHVQEGDTVVWQGGTEMGEFRSPTMDRTFENILFVERIWLAR